MSKKPIAHQIPPAYSLDRISTDLKILKSPPVTKTPNNLVANLEFSGFIPDHLDFIAFLAKIMTEKSSITTTPVISKPSHIKRINTLVSPFVHAKTKNVFEQKTYFRVLQVYDTHTDNVQEIVKALINIMPPGINLKVENFNHVTMDKLLQEIPRENQVDFKDSFEDKVQKRMEEFIKEFSKSKSG